MRPISKGLFSLLLITAPLAAQNQVLEPDPFKVVGEKAGDEAAEDGDAAPAGSKEPPAPAKEKEQEPLTAQISAHILKLAEAERDNRMSFMRIVIDDIVRLCELDEEQRGKLELAAKGAAERSMKEWHEQAERYFRTRLESTDPDAAKEMLEGMGSVNFGGNRSEEEGESLDLWKDSLAEVLTDEQVKRYEAVLEQREADRIDAFARMSVSTIDDHLRLTPTQKTKIGEIVQASAADYLEDIQRYWGDYFERGMLMSLANAAEEDALKAILTEQQFDRLREATSNFDHFWDQKRRLKRAKEKASERRKNGEEEKEYEEKEAAAPAQGAGGVIRIGGGANGAVIIKGGAIGGNGGNGVKIEKIEIKPAAPAPAKADEPKDQ
jgi:hypothetical protein